MQEYDTGYRPRNQFLQYHLRAQRWSVIVAHRRAGKTVACVADLIDSALRCLLPSPRVAYVAPLYKQAKDVAWGYLKEYTRNLPDRTVHESELRVDLPNGGRVRLYGADNPDALRGIYLDDCVLDEYADMRPRFLPEVIRPALSDRKGRLTIIGTPRGRNEFFDLYDGAVHGFPDEFDKTKRTKDADWFALMLRASETGLVDDEELKSARRMMSEAQYAQEYECSFEAAIEGAYYGHLINKAEAEGRIGAYPWKPGLPVYTAWDLGVGDDTSIWFAQRDGGYLNLIDHYATNGQAASHYVQLIKSKSYVYAKHFLPHDVENREWVSGATRLDTLRSLGLSDLAVVGRVPVDDGINAARLVLPICRFDRDKCASGLESLRQYRREYDENKRAFKPTPLHDWTSHDADAFRYLALGLEPEAGIPVDIPRYSGKRDKWKGQQSSGRSWMTA